MKAIIKPPVAAPILGLRENELRVRIRNGRYKQFAEYIPKEARKRENAEYNIFVAKLEAYIGRPLTEDEINPRRKENGRNNDANPQKGL